MLAEGSILSGRYRLVSRLGRGGMGAVWRAEHLGLNSFVAIKLIDEEVVRSEETLARFKREAQAAASLRMSNVVQILDYGVDGQTPYIAMEVLEGETLAARLERQGFLTPSETATIVSQVGRALARAHELGVVHRDLKPDNIFLVADGDQEIAKVLDFGIAKTLGTDPGRALLNTSTGALLGTPYYMSPEQAMAQGDVDHLTDIWALGVLTFECITGTRPFDGQSIGAIVVRICSEPLPIPSARAEVPVGFDEWFFSACHREREARFQSAAQATKALRQVCGVDFTRSSISSFPPLSLRDSVVGGSAPHRTVVGHVATPTPTIVGGTPEPALLTLPEPEAPMGRAVSRRRWTFGASAGVLLVLGVLSVLGAFRDDEPTREVVASDSGGKTAPSDDGASPVADTDVLTLDDLALESAEDRARDHRAKKERPQARSAPVWNPRGASVASPSAPQPPSDAAPPPEPVPAAPDKAAPGRAAPDAEQRLAF